MNGKQPVLGKVTKERGERTSIWEGAAKMTVSAEKIFKRPVIRMRRTGSSMKRPSAGKRLCRNKKILIDKRQRSERSAR